MRGPASLQGSGRRRGGCVAHEGSQRSHCSLALHKFPASQTNTAWSCPQPASQVEKLRVSGEPGLLLSKRWSGLRSPGEVFSQSRGCSTSPPSGLGNHTYPTESGHFRARTVLSPDPPGWSEDLRASGHVVGRDCYEVT